MKKRSKILVSLAMFVLSVSMLVFGVWSAGNVTFNISSNISFTPSGVFVGVSGRVLTGSDINNLTAVQTMTERKNFSDGQQAGEAIENWAPTDIALTETTTIAQYEFTFTNYSAFAISVTPSDGTTAKVEGGITKTEDTSNVASIDEDATGTYTVTYQLTSFNDPASVVVDINFDIQYVKFVRVKNSSGDKRAILVNGVAPEYEEDGFWTCVPVGSKVEFKTPSTSELLDSFGVFDSNGDYSSELKQSLINSATDSATAKITGGVESYTYYEYIVWERLPDLGISMINVTFRYR